MNEWDEPLGAGEVGELVVRTREPWSINAGYYKMPEATVTAWRNGWFHTGDAARYDEDGWFYLVDRISDTIRHRGENISSFELETFVADHPDVVECAAVGVPAEYGHHDVLVVMIVHDRTTFEPRRLVEHLDPRVPGFMLPRYIRVVDDLLRTRRCASASGSSGPRA